ncbi:hypothetical protein EV360DRAFT_90532 [Lentinula raphanica]|nr:hypothetical protein EV360DRAFT_90532 [Lentinula raphanica]
MSFTESARFDIINTERFDISRRGSCSPETTTTTRSSTRDPLDPDSPRSLKFEGARDSLMDDQRYDYSKRSSRSSTINGSMSFKSEAGLVPAIDPKAVIERLKLLDAQRYDPKSRSCSPEPSEYDTFGSKPLAFMLRDDSDSSSSNYDFTSDSPSAYSLTPGTSASEGTESVSDTASSIQFARPEESPSTQITSTWHTGPTITTRTVIHPGGTRRGRPPSSKSSTSIFPPPLSRALSPKSSRAILRSLNCLTNEAGVDSELGTDSDGKSIARTVASEPLTIFVTHQVEAPLTDEQREREQLWREAMCSLHFGGDWEQMNKRFPPGRPRW